VREADRRGWAFVVTAMNEALRARGATNDALKLTLDKLNSTVPDELRQRAIRSARQNIQIAVNEGEAGRISPAERFQLLLNDAKTRLHVATTHSRRQP
jgi:hypothetical protein